MKKLQVLTVLATEVREDKQGREYKHLTVESPSDINGIKVEAKVSGFNAYEENYLGNKEFGWDLNVGDKMMGEFITRSVKPYTINGKDAEGNATSRTVESATCIVRPIAGQQEINELSIARAFAAAGHELTTDVVEEVEAAVEELTA